MTAEAGLAIRVLGVPIVTGAPASPAFPAKGFQLIALLARSPSSVLRRREAASLLWDCRGDAETLGNLRQLLARIRRLPAPHGEYVTADVQMLTLGPGAKLIDLCAFTALAGSERSEDALEAVGLFRGDLLESMADATDDFLHWLRRERALLREQFFSAASLVLVELTRYGRASVRDLKTLADRMIAVDPERETSYRVLIEAFGRNGNFQISEHLYGELIEMLAREHGARPAPETVAVARRVFAAAGNRAAEAPEQHQSALPRIAFLVPRQLGCVVDAGLLHALIEDVANELTRYRTFAVIATHTSFQTDHDSGVPLDNARLRADYTVSGFVRPGRSGQVLVLRMTKCATGEVTWAGEFPFDGADLAELFRRIATRVASGLAAELERDTLADLRRGGSTGAYRRYLEGQEQLRLCDLPRLRRARAAFRDAAAIDRAFAAPHARIAQTLYLEWLILGGGDPLLLQSAREAARRSLALDPHSALGHWMSGAVALYQRDFAHAQAAFAEAETLNPNSADLLLERGDILAYVGKADVGWQRFEQAIDLNPLPPDHYWWAGASIAFNRGDYSGAIELCGRLGSDDPVLRILAASHARLGDHAAARHYAWRLVDAYPGMSAAEMVKLVPYQDLRERDAYADALRWAGVP